MFGLEFAAIGLLHLATAPQMDCSPQKALTIDVIPRQDPVLYDYTKTTSEINEIGKGAYSAYGADHDRVELRGLTVGKQTLEHNIEFYFEKREDLDLACLQVRHVKIIMDYKPTVYVSSKYEQGTPIFEKVLEHEMEHVRITQDLLYEYAAIMERRLKNALKRGYSLGPFKISEMKRKQQELGRGILDVLSSVNGAMHKEATKQHNAFDDETLREVQQYNQGVARKLETILKLNE